MNNKLSELVDGELGDGEAHELIKLAGKNNELLAQWEAYHVIGEALRQPGFISSLDISEKVHQQLINEPAILVPQFGKIYRAGKSKLLGLSAAASIAVLAIGWMVSVSIDTNPVQQEMLVADKMENGSINTNNRSVTFMPPTGYSHLPASIDYNRTEFPFISRGFTHGGVIYHPHHSSINQIHVPQMPQTSAETPPPGN